MTLAVDYGCNFYHLYVILFYSPSVLNWPGHAVALVRVHYNITYNFGFVVTWLISIYVDQRGLLLQKAVQTGERPVASDHACLELSCHMFEEWLLKKLTWASYSQTNFNYSFSTFNMFKGVQ